MEDLVRQADKDGLLKDDELQQLKRTLTENNEDQEKARAFLLRRVEAEGEHELQKLDLSHRFGLSQERLSFEVASARREMEGRWDLKLQRVNLEIEQQRRLNEFRREQGSQDKELGNRSQIEEARTGAAVADIDRHPTLARRPNRRQNLAVLNDVIAETTIGMGQHIAGAQ